MTKLLERALTAATLSVCIAVGTLWFTSTHAKADGSVVAPAYTPVPDTCVSSRIQVWTGNGQQWYQQQECRDSD